MYIAPIGIANAGDPDGAFAEAADVAGAHQSSYGREAAAVLAAAVAEAMRPDATVTSIVETTLRLAHDGTRAAIDAVAAAASDAQRLARRRTRRRCARPSRRTTRSASTTPRPSLGARIPSRLQAIEELPIAIGLLVATGGDFAETVLGGVNYGRDSDSIASMGGALAGALGGTAALRADWTEQVATASRYDLEEPGRTMAAVAVEIFRRDVERQARRADAITSLTAQPSLDGVLSFLEGDVDPARGSDRARAAPGTRGGEERRRGGSALARRGRRTRAGARRVAGGGVARATSARLDAARRDRAGSEPARR